MLAAENLNQLRRRMDCRVEPGNDERKKEERKEAERRQTQCFMTPCQRARRRATKSRLAPTLRCGRARLSAFHHGTCGSDRTPRLSSSYALPGTGLGRSGCYPPRPSTVQRVAPQ